MTDLLENIVKSIVNHPDDVFIEEKESVDFPGLTILTINVNEEDKGIIIGRKGRTINSIRDIITISAIRNNKREKERDAAIIESGYEVFHVNEKLYYKNLFNVEYNNFQMLLSDIVATVDFDVEQKIKDKLKDLEETPRGKWHGKAINI